MTHQFPLSPDLDEASRAANLAMQGKLNSTGEVALTNDNVATTTVVNNPYMTDNSLVFFDPIDSVAAGELASGSMYVTEANRSDGTFTITHTASASTREFRYLIIG